MSTCMNVRMYRGRRKKGPLDEEKGPFFRNKHSVRVVVSLLPTSEPPFFVREKYSHLRQPFDWLWVELGCTDCFVVSLSIFVKPWFDQCAENAACEDGSTSQAGAIIVSLRNISIEGPKWWSCCWPKKNCCRPECFNVSPMQWRQSYILSRQKKLQSILAHILCLSVLVLLSSSTLHFIRLLCWWWCQWLHLRWGRKASTLLCGNHKKLILKLVVIHCPHVKTNSWKAEKLGISMQNGQNGNWILESWIKHVSCGFSVLSLDRCPSSQSCVQNSHSTHLKSPKLLLRVPQTRLWWPFARKASPPIFRYLRHLNATECILRHSVTIKASDLLWCKFPLLKKSSFACQILGNEGQLFLGRLILASCWKLKQKPPPTLTFRNWFSEIAFFALLALRI